MHITTVGTVRLLEPTTRRERARGLLGRETLGPDEALLLRRCRSVHTLGMRFPIDVVLLDRDDLVIRVLPVRPGRLVLPRPRVRHVLETAAGHGARLATAILPRPRRTGTGPHRLVA